MSLSIRSIFGIALGLSAAAHAQFQDFKGYTGFDIGSTSQIRFPNEFQLADLDGDGLNDLAVVSQNLPRLGIQLNQGDGTFGPATFQVLLSDAIDLTHADFDFDGDIDIAVAEGGATTGSGQTVAFFRNSGKGTFTLSQRITVSKGPAGIAAGDFDGDGDIDVAVAHFGIVGTGTTIRVLRNSGTGSFALGNVSTVSVAPYGLRAGDLNGDGRADLVAVHHNDVLSILLSQGTTFATPVVFNVLGSTVLGAHIFPCVSLVDIDLDGDLDIAFSDNNHQKMIPLLRGIVTVVVNQGNGSFTLGNDIVLRPYQSGFTDLEFADLNGDGWPDVLGVDRFDWDYVLSNGSGGFVAPTTASFGLIASDEPTSIASLDADHDGDLDAMILGSHSNAITIHRFTNGEPDLPPFYEGPEGELDYGDLDGDGDLDIVAGGLGPIFVTFNQGGGAFSAVTTYPSGAFNGPTTIRLADFNSDGRPDVIVGTLSGFNTRMNLGNGTFGSMVQWNFSNCGSSDLDVVDLNNDGKLDVVIPESGGCIGSTSPPRVFIAKGNGDGTFVQPISFTTTWLTERLTHADIDADGFQDILLTGNTTIDIHRGNGNFTFKPKIAVPADFSPHGIATADFNHDGVLDLASCNWGDVNNDNIDESMTVMLGIDGTSFAPPQLYIANGSWDLGSTFGITAVDIDRDGDSDLAVTNFDSHDLSLFRNRGDGTFLPATRIGGLRDLTDAVIADFTGDGIVDAILTGNPWMPYIPPSILVLEGLGNDPWTALGSGITGTHGVPRLNGDGALVPANSVTLRVSKARKSASGVFFIGVNPLMTPLLGGVLVPEPTLILPFVTDTQGTATIGGSLPLALPGGFDVYAQAFVLDPLAPNGYAAASEGVRAHSP